jgi:prepilin-type N-terminal cleavage/methylation domain-containing protein
MSQNRQPWQAFSLMELMAVLAIVAFLAAVIVPRAIAPNDTAKKNACYTYKREIELQAKLWRRNNGSYPTSNLSTIGADAGYFPSGLPTCPVDGSAYTIDTTTGLVTGHTH